MRLLLLLVVVVLPACAPSNGAFWEPKTGIRIGAAVPKSKDPSPELAAQQHRVCPLPTVVDGERATVRSSGK
jgi:hypothetical protein